MMPEPWLYGAMLAVSILNMGVFLYARYQAERSRPADPTELRCASHGTTVSCPDCGTANEQGYRFCRRCIAELPGAVPPTGPSRLPTGRGIA